MNDVIHRGESDEFFAKVDRLIVSASLAILVGLTASMALLWWQPLSDPIDVIGLPLIRGYSEATERQVAFVFVGSAIATVLIFNHFFRPLDTSRPDRSSQSLFAILGMFGLVVFLSLPFWQFHWWTTLTWISLLAISAIIGRVLPPLNQFPSVSSHVIAGTIAVFLPAHFYLDARGTISFTPIACIFLSTLIEWVVRARRPQTDELFCSLIGWSLLWSSLLFVIYRENIALLTGLSFAAFCLYRSRLKEWNGALRYLAAFMIVIGVIWIPDLFLLQMMEAVVFGALFAWGLEFAFAPYFSVDAFSLSSARLFSVVGAGLAILFVVVMPQAPWIILTTVIAAIVCQWGPSWIRWPVLMLLLASCFINLDPTIYNKKVDPFHDGQIVSAVWEWNHGKMLFSEVYPLRLTEILFYWVVRPFVGEDRSDFLFTFQLFAALGPLGVIVLVYSIIRSLFWSWSSAIVVGALFPLDPRAGTCMFLLGISAWLLRYQAISILPMSLVGVASMWLGYDAMLIVIGATIAAMMTPAAGVNLFSDLRRNTFASLLFVISTLAIFSSTLAIGQGVSAVEAYFLLFWEYARYYPAFYGYPITHDFSQIRTTLIAAAVVVGGWLAVLIPLRDQLSLTQRRHAVLLLVSMLVFAQRALARSDATHREVFLYPMAVFVSVGLFWLCEYLRKNDQRMKLIEPFIAMTCVLVACQIYVGPQIPPATWLMKPDVKGASQWPEPREDVLALVGPDDSLWQIQDGLWPFIHHRINPTRHALAYCIGWPKESNRAVQAMEANPPKVVEFEPVIGTDYTPNIFFNPVIADYLYEHYKPVLDSDILVPSPTRWRGWSTQYSNYSSPFELGQLPVRWGSSLSHFLPRILSKETLVPGPSRQGRDGNGPSQTISLDIEPSPRDHLMLKLSINGSGKGVPKIDVRFAGPDGVFDSMSQEEFAGQWNDGTYLVPIGLCQGWAWRDRITTIQITIEEADSFSVDEAELWVIRRPE